MVRSKRKRTREELEEALHENERINATPMREEKDARKRRQTKRRKKRYDLNKELKALSVHQEATAVTEFTEGQANGIEEREEKTEESDPVLLQRRFAAEMEAAYQAETEDTALFTVPVVSGSADREDVPVSAAQRARDKRANRTLSQADRERTRDAQRARTRRINMTLSQRDRARKKDAERKRARRAQLRGEELHEQREQNRQQQTAHRAELREPDREAVRGRDRLQHASRRAQMSGQQQEHARELNRQQHAHWRANLSDQSMVAERELNRQRHADRRAEQTQDERQYELERVRTRRQCARHGHALISLEDFDASKITGYDVVNGRHKLPATTICPICNAWKWPGESAISCCLAGRVNLPPLHPAPRKLLQLYGDPEFRRQIRAYNQAFAFTSIGASCSNRSFQNVHQDESVAGTHGVYTYRIQGAMGHYLGSLLPHIDRRTGARVAPKFAQIYIVDPDMQRRAERRLGIFADLDRVALLDIEKMMAEHNPLAQRFLHFGQQVRQHNTETPVDLVFRLHDNSSRPRTHNRPTVSEVAATLIEDGNLAQPRDLLLFTRDQRLLRLYETHADYDPLQYPLLLPYGEKGWTYTDEFANGAEYRNKKAMSLREHVAFRLHQKVDDQSALHQGGRLFQQWCVDQRAKCEQEQLRWVADNQKTLRADQYRGVQDALLNEDTLALAEGEVLLSEYDRAQNRLVHPDRDGGSRARPTHFLNQVGKRIILPASHLGSPRSMYKSYQDSMAIVREYGRPDVFLTETCNPKWDEILEAIPSDIQTAQDRPDIVARVWQQKLQATLDDLNQGVLGRVRARIYVVEFQKRGLPHAHVLVILADEDKPRTREIVDKMVCAEIPDKDTNPQLYETVMSCMLHGPCGPANPSCACMKDGKCTKGYPKPLAEVTQANANGYPVYRRRRQQEGVLKFKGREYDNATINQWVVPYNPYLSQKYNCHINVEVCTDITAVKYLYKYVYKGPDMAILTVEEVRGGQQSARREPNEILRFLSARYISPVEACMRLLDFTIQGKTHAVTQLTVHLESGQTICFRETENPEAVLERGSHTMLTRFFELCASEEPQNHIARTMLYQDIPKEFCWKAPEKGQPKRWVRRKQYQAAVGRMIHVSPRDMERFYLRLLLCQRRGPTSFEDLRTVNGIVCPTFQIAAREAGYLENDNEWVSCLTEAAEFQMPYQLRQLFVTILVYSAPANVGVLWDRFFADLSQDFARKHQALMDPFKSALVEFETLMSIQELLQASGYAVADFDELPQLGSFPTLIREALRQNGLLRRELTGYDASALEAIVNTEDQLNESQRVVYDQIIEAVECPEEGKKLFFVDGPGGTGKSTLLRNILAKVRLSEKIAIAVASSGIASLLLMGGRTAHSTFKIPLKLNESSTCGIRKNSHIQELIKHASLIIWDEAPMAHRHAFEAVDRTLRDILDNDTEPFGGKVFVLSGDFRQILPVVKNGTPVETIDACLKSSRLWPQFQTFRLTENMRVRTADTADTAEEMAAFSEFLLQVGEGRHDVNPSLGNDYMKIPRDMLIENPPVPDDEDQEIRPGVIPRGMDRIIDEMYGEINNPEVATDEYFANRTILTTTNAIVHRINEAVTDRLTGQAREYMSSDSVQDDGDGNFFEQEVLHSMNISGMPPHKLTLKVGMPIMMMRNLNPDLGLCNGTRLRIVALKPHVIHATIMTGERQGQHVLIPRIVFISDGDIRSFPFHLRRKQFPVQPAFAMTINKAQGQTVQYLGLYLATPCFSHGQLYVAMSRVTSRSRFKALVEYPKLEEEDGVYAQNIVYRQIFGSE
ncbi:helitron helicase-like protein [Phytophthora infestans T30-4]|uniref:ATP-dependent DNA helicase n=1 Tax=Phytophthora infestans (strain T30-4) TaxID=403677 RepID=D0MT84_PHYIT|nr:helitron helicase-like protein [Phytophthora infestans T30-4]EEY61181.1 helitron helicase-like protein [Phytophthora infestans T30-4]|eukprot:XP_002908098.1 helitron helicase-like protein [Phytophthora infestans T30-4]